MFFICKYSISKYYCDFLLRGPRVETVVWLGYAKFVRFSEHSVAPERLRNAGLGFLWHEECHGTTNHVYQISARISNTFAHTEEGRQAEGV